MPAYFVAQYSVNDADGYRRYQQGAVPTVAAAGAKVIAFDAAAESIEGTPPGPQTVILEFEDTAAAKAWYDSAEYQQVVGLRLESTDGFAVLAQSMNQG
ncbi:DUF1330 domain-containing protein [Candidatus Poriferisodalis sp.]|uniref:DUF1330 domain-containing protein n=1 Tax=Candidatus Poriferisodalis sp. TaxID=3101277 RepID=UPI003B01D2F1